MHCNLLVQKGKVCRALPNPMLLTQVAIPLSAGIKYILGQRFSIALELGYRFTFTDYIDDVSGGVYCPEYLARKRCTCRCFIQSNGGGIQGFLPTKKIGSRRGNSNTNDAYMIWGISLSVNIATINVKKASKKQSFQWNKWL